MRFLLFLLPLLTIEGLAASYNWNGTTSTAWSTSTNWTPNGVPGSGDNVTIFSSPNNPIYDGVAGVTDLTITSGILDLGGFTLTTSGTNLFTSGTVQNGTLASVSASNTTFNNTTFSASCTINIISGRVNINGGTFNGPVTLIQNGTSQTTGTGMAIFNNATIIECAGSGNFRIQGGLTFNNTAHFKLSSSGYLLTELNSGNTYNGDVTLTITGSGNLRSAYQGNTQFNGNIVLENTGTGYIYFCEQAGATATLANTKTVSVGAGGFSSGRLYLYRFTQIGSTDQNISMTGTGRCFLGPATTFNGNTTIISSAINLDGVTFNGDSYLEQNGAINPQSIGGNIFNGSTTLVNSGSGYILFGNTTPDIFNGALTITNSGNNYIYLAYNSTGNQFNSTVTLNNNSATSASDVRVEVAYGSSASATFSSDVTINNTSNASGTSLVRFSYNGNTTFNGHIICNNTSSATGTNGIYIGSNNGSSTLANTKTITIGGSGFSTGRLSLRNFTQTGVTPQNITLTGTSMIQLRAGTTFNANVVFTAPQIMLDGTTFNGTSYIEKNGAGDNQGVGGNTFNSTTELISSGSGYFATGWTNPDIFNDNVTLTSTGSARVLVGWSSTGNQFNGDIIVNSIGSSAGIGISGNAAGSSILAATKSIHIGGLGFSSGYLLLERLTQLGNAPISLTLDPTANYIRIGPATTIGGIFSVTAPNIQPYGATYNGTTIFTKTGGTDNHNNGNLNIFNSTVIINQQSSSGYFMLGYNSADSFADDITVTNTGTSNIYLGYSSGTGTPTLAAGKTINVGGTGFNGGSLYFGTFTQNGNADVNLTFTGTAALYFANNSVFGGNITTNTPSLYFNGATFNGTVHSEKTGASANTNTGGNTFNQEVTIINSGSGNLTLANTSPDIFNDNVIFTNTGTQIIYPAYNAPGNQFNGDIIVNSTGSSVGISFCGGSSGSATIAAGKKIQVGGLGFTSGYLILPRITQLGNAPINLNLTASASYIQFGPNSSFGGDVTVNAPGINLNGTTFSGTVDITKTGSSSNTGSGGNTFNNTTTFTNSGTGYLGTGWTNPDIFNGDLYLTNSGSSYIYLAYSHSALTPTQFNGNITFNSTGSSTGILIGWSTGTATLANTKVIQIGGSGFTSGILGLRNFTQSGVTAQTLSLTGTATLQSGPASSFSGAITFTAPQILLNGATYSGTTAFEKTGAGNNASAGGNIFNNTVSITNSGSGYLLMGNGTPDSFNGNATFTNVGSSDIRIAWTGAATVFNENIIVNCTSGLGIAFGNNTSDVTLASGKTITIGGLGFSVGTLTLRRFTQNGATPQSLTLIGTAILTLGNLSMFNGNVNFTSPQVYLNGATYNGTATIEKTGATTNNGTGGNTFNGITQITNSGSGILLTALSSADTYNADVTFTNSGSSYIRTAYIGSNSFNGNIICNSTSGTGIYFCENASGSATLATGKTININTFSAGTLWLQRFTQNGSTAQTITMTGSGSLQLGPAVQFNANTTLTCPQIYLNGVTFNGICSLEKNGATNNTSNGGNVFNSTTTIKNSSNAIFRLANSSADDFNGNVTFQQTGSGALQPAYNANCTFSKDISTAGTTTAITFASNTGRVTIDGNTAQAFNGNAAQTPIIRRLTMATSNTDITLNVPINISSANTSGDLTMTTGKIITTAANILTLADEAVTTTTGNANSYVNGPMNYTMSLNGTTTLYFPIGKSTYWRPFELTPTHNAGTAYIYTGELIMEDADALGYTLPGSVSHVSKVRYWQIDRSSSSTNLTSSIVKLYYDMDDGINDYTNVTVVKNTSAAPTTWTDIGGTANANGIGNITSGSFNSFSKFALGNRSGGINPLPVELLYFNVEQNNKQVNIDWSTTSEINNDFFTIQRSENGSVFSDLARVNGAGNSVKVCNYNAIDDSPLPGISYYRLKQTDFNGKSSYSSIATVDFNNNVPLAIYTYPNIASSISDVSIIIEGNKNETVEMSLTDIVGKQIISKKLVLDGGNATTQLNEYTELPSGNYFIIIQGNNRYASKRIVIK